MGLAKKILESDDAARKLEFDYKEFQQQQNQNQNSGGDGMDYMKVMTDEQIEELRLQISAYTTISEQLVEMHKSIAAQQELSGMRLGGLYCDPLLISASQKTTTRQRWTPTPVQLQALERVFDQGTGTPSKQKITEITAELSQHGPISDTNVYNWFQNRRARLKRKQSGAFPNYAESETETEVESPKEKKKKPENFRSFENSAPRAESLYLQSPELGADLHCLDMQPNKEESMLPPQCDLGSSSSLDHLCFYGSGQPNPSVDQLIGKLEVPTTFDHYQQEEEFDILR